MKKYCRFIGMSLGLFLLAGCSSFGAEQSPFTEAEQQVIWHGERSGTFGNYDYTDLENEAEAKEILTTKFNLVLPENYESLQKELASSPLLKDKQLLGEASEVIVSDQQVNYHIQHHYGKEAVEVVVEFSLTYTVTEENKRVILADQSVLLQDVTETGSAGLYDAAAELVPPVAKKLSFGSVEKELNRFMEEHSSEEAALSQQSVVIVENAEEAQKNKGLQKSIQIYYDAVGKLREIYFNLTDLSET